LLLVCAASSTMLTTLPLRVGASDVCGVATSHRVGAFPTGAVVLVTLAFAPMVDPLTHDLHLS
jgi:hypothetical protein